MTTALVVEGSGAAGVDVAADLVAVGIHVLGATPRGSLVQDAARHAPDVVVCHEASPDDALFDACALLAETTPRPVVVFANDPEAGKIDRALSSGVHSYVVNGYAQSRLRSVIHVAQSRFAHETKLRGELADVTRRFDERKLVDRAKGILMRARQVSEDEAFAVLRAASMHSNRRVGQVSKQVIAAAHYADAVNRAGKLRMLSQRLVKLAAICVIEKAHAREAKRLAETGEQIDAHIAALARSLSKPTFGDLLDAVADAWAHVRGELAPTPAKARLVALDAAAERLLGQADRLVRQLESTGLVTTLAILNLSGRQRMLSQRYAKAVLLAIAFDDGAAKARSDAADAELATTARAFEEALARLAAAPLSTAEIRALLAEAADAWREETEAARPGPGKARALDRASDAVLDVFERLTDRYERSMQVLMG